LDSIRPDKRQIKLAICGRMNGHPEGAIYRGSDDIPTLNILAMRLQVKIQGSELIAGEDIRDAGTMVPPGSADDRQNSRGGGCN